MSIREYLSRFASNVFIQLWILGEKLDLSVSHWLWIKLFGFFVHTGRTKDYRHRGTSGLSKAYLSSVKTRGVWVSPVMAQSHACAEDWWHRFGNVSETRGKHKIIVCEMRNLACRNLRITDFRKLLKRSLLTKICC